MDATGKLHFTKKPLFLAMLISVSLAGCGGDFEPSSRIIEEGQTDQEQTNQDTARTLTTNLSVDQASLQIYNLSDGELIAEGTLVEDTDAPSPAAQFQYTLDQTVRNSALILSVLTVPEGSTYFDPILGRSVTLDEEKSFVSLAQGRYWLSR